MHLRRSSSFSAKRWMKGLLDGSSNGRKKPTKASTFSEKDPATAPKVK